jgi:hypothetical protein
MCLILVPFSPEFNPGLSSFGHFEPLIANINLQTKDKF